MTAGTFILPYVVYLDVEKGNLEYAHTFVGGMKMNAKTAWRMTAIAGIAATLVLLYGFGYGVKDILYPVGAELSTSQKLEVTSPNTSDFSQKSNIQVISLGDSLTRGTGDASGNGYVRNVVNELGKKLNKPVKLLNNLGINGLRADQLVLKMDEPGFKNAIKGADLILMTIGGNDLFNSAMEGKFTEQSFDLNQLMNNVDKSSHDLTLILTKLNKLNPNAKLVYVGLYNPLADVPSMREIGNRVVEKWNNLAMETIVKYPNMTLVPTLDLFQETLPQYISSDHFHPNSLGYQQIAYRIVQGIAP